MRRSHNAAWLLDDNNLIGFYFGSDFCAEHEWGIDKIRRHFPDNSKETPGIEGVKLESFDSNSWKYLATKNENKAVLLFSDFPWNFEKLNQYSDYKPQELQIYGNKEIVAAWSSSDFGIHVQGKHNVSNLEKIWEAAQKCDLACWLGGNRLPVFDNPGLILVIPSQASSTSKAQLKETHESRNAFDALVEKVESETNIKNRLTEYGFKWFALSPYNGNKNHDTKYPIVYFLNPWEYKQYHQWNMHHGWVTIETLEKFLAGDDSVIVLKPHAKGH